MTDECRIVVDNRLVSWIWNMVGRRRLHQVFRWLCVSPALSPSPDSHIGRFMRCDVDLPLSNVEGYGSIPMPYELWPQNYKDLAAPLYYILTGGWSLLL